MGTIPERADRNRTISALPIDYKTRTHVLRLLRHFGASMCCFARKVRRGVVAMRTDASVFAFLVITGGFVAAKSVQNIRK